MIYQDEAKGFLTFHKKLRPYEGQFSEMSSKPSTFCSCQMQPTNFFVSPHTKEVMSNFVLHRSPILDAEENYLD